MTAKKAKAKAQEGPRHKREHGTATVQLAPLRVTEEEREWVRAQADSYGLTVTEWLRSRVLRGYQG